ncbi:hypothetical protein MRX96_005076 [Rhipicephalus microplus]
MPFQSLHQQHSVGVRRKRLLQRPTLRLGQPRDDMSTAKTRRTRPATSAACDITPPRFMRWNSGYSKWFDRGSPEKSLSSFEIDDASFLECLVNDVGSPDDSLRRPFLARTPPQARSGAAAKAMASSMPDLLEPPVPAAPRVEVEEQAQSKPRTRNSFVFSAFSKMPFSSTKRSGSCAEITPSNVDQR